MAVSSVYWLLPKLIIRTNNFRKPPWNTPGYCSRRLVPLTFYAVLLSLPFACSEAANVKSDRSAPFFKSFSFDQLFQKVVLLVELLCCSIECYGIWISIMLLRALLFHGNLDGIDNQIYR